MTTKEIQRKIEIYCAYQERCHLEVYQKLRGFTNDEELIANVIVKLIADNYLNEERFARSFARGKHRIKFWGNIRIKAELRFKKISAYNINAALSEIAPIYNETFETISLKCWETISESSKQRKRKKFCDALLRKGYESDLVHARLNIFESAT